MLLRYLLMDWQHMLSRVTLFVDCTVLFYTFIMHAHCIYPVWALLKLLQSVLLWIPLSNRTEWGYCNTSNFFQTHVCQTFVFSQMHVCWEGRKCLSLYSNLAVNSKIATIGDSLGFDILSVCHRFCSRWLQLWFKLMVCVRSLCALTWGHSCFHHLY